MHINPKFRGALLAASVVALSHQSATAQAGPEAVQEAVETQYDSHLEDLFIWFHQNPELSLLESNTAARMAAELRAAGLEVTEGVGGTGVVGMLRNGDGPLILLRADMDGLPVKERSGLEYASTVTQTGLDGQEYPVMHACGHDVHITSLVGTARQLVAMQDQWSGTLMFIVQPAEERVAGAKAMLDDGLYDRFGTPDYALAFHVSAGEPTGTIIAAPGIFGSSSDSVNLHVPGIGAHGASPHEGRDPIYIASQIVVGLQSIVSRETNPLTPAVVTVGAFNAGSKHNIIGEGADLQLTVRANDEETRAATIAAIERIATNIGRAHGLPEDKLPSIEVVEGTPVTWNEQELADRLIPVFVETFGDDAVGPYEQDGMGAEDFAYFVADEYGVPGFYFSVGGTAPEDIAAEEAGGPPVASHHSPLFRIEPRESVTLGTRAMVAAVLDLAGS
ncbi:amidohydrolase [Aurantiacibacter rhizosphaerae]|uniref:Amidohydrolase n=1 Tax=Aurantiacibacter rhizosphaerae TaxID=2691582 RepID=A0A844XC45_9SPHN|nr:amidohydrolase [Aurantiacibacter rhizosphaerae]MWV27282.1 amidohydrolase [Aurantiacibacter rhizosphaerae]